MPLRHSFALRSSFSGWHPDSALLTLGSFSCGRTNQISTLEVWRMALRICTILSLMMMNFEFLMPFLDDVCRAENMQPNSSLSQRKTKAHVDDTGDAATQHAARPPKRRNQLMPMHQPWCKLKRRDLPVLRCGEKPPFRDPNASAPPKHSQHIACLHLVLLPCCTARARVTKLFLHTGH